MSMMNTMKRSIEKNNELRLSEIHKIEKLGIGKLGKNELKE